MKPDKIFYKLAPIIEPAGLASGGIILGMKEVSPEVFAIAMALGGLVAGMLDPYMWAKAFGRHENNQVSAETRVLSIRLNGGYALLSIVAFGIAYRYL